MVEVSGRTYPVEVALAADARPDEERQRAGPARGRAGRGRGSWPGSTAATCSSSCPPSATSTRRPRRSAAGRCPATPRGKETEILPLYARLSIQEQQRVFHPGPKRRIVIATNVAESSLTVPRIRFVIDPGTARISRYSPRTQDAAAADRGGLAGLGRPAARAAAAASGRASASGCSARRTTWPATATPCPEIQRTNLAAVILQMKALRLGEHRRLPAPRSAPSRRRPRRLPHALRAGGHRRAAGADRDRPPPEPPAGRSADRADDPGRDRRGLPGRGADHRRGPGGAGPARAAAGEAGGGRRLPTPSSPTSSPISSAT